VEGAKFSVQLVTFLSGFSGLTAYGAIFGILLACGMGVPIPEDITLIAAGILAAIGSISYWGAMAAGFFGVLIGDCFLFMLGRKYGYRVFSLPGFRTVFTERRVLLARQKVLNNSKFICFTARFLPGLRAPIYLTAGIMGVRPLVFLTLDGLAALISVPIWVHMGFLFGENMDKALETAIRAQKYIVGGVVLVILFYVWWRIRAKRREEALLNKINAPIPPISKDQSPQV
jgi:membrane protein DedA with SNARE-associated domain